MIWMESITKTYMLGEVEVPVLKEINLSIEEGEYVAIMGSIWFGKINTDEYYWLSRPSDIWTVYP